MIRNRSASKRALLPTLLCLALITSCSTDGGAPSDTPRGESTNSSTSQDSGVNMPQVSGAANEAPTITAPVGDAPSELVTEDVIAGTGAEASANSTLTVHYTLMAWSTGQIVESSWGGDPATFGLNQVIVGWQQGIPGMKEGGRRLLVIPPVLGYGEAGGGPIGPNETLIFVVDLIKVS